MSLRKPFLALLYAACALRTGAAQSYEVKGLLDIMVPARDGVKLATNVFLPGNNGSIAEGRLPAIVERTPYNKDGVDGSLIQYYLSHGYAVVTQDVRGRYHSEGRWAGNRNDGADGSDL